ncbi:MAG: winged helix-turn-helix transcriptional regulator [Gammaproteobacteria bacterium]|nr:MAG: winged helix-turn-helix transcriptional regulator [Gammaproteobacteria bacterium]
MNGKDREDGELMLELLDVIDKNSEVSQRHLASHLGVALGLANSYLKRCVRKGLIKIIEAPANRYLYYLTPKGFSEKTSLTAQYLKRSFSFYREASDACERVFEQARQQGWNKILLCGMSDLAEIALLRASECQIEIVGLYDPHTERNRFINKPVWHGLDKCGEHHACVITDIHAPEMTYKDLLRHTSAQRILIPGVLRLAPNTNGS